MKFFSFVCFRKEEQPLDLRVERKKSTLEDENQNLIFSPSPSPPPEAADLSYSGGKKSVDFRRSPTGQRHYRQTSPTGQRHNRQTSPSGQRHYRCREASPSPPPSGPGPPLFMYPHGGAPPPLHPVVLEAIYRDKLYPPPAYHR